MDTCDQVLPPLRFLYFGVCLVVGGQLRMGNQLINSGWAVDWSPGSHDILIYSFTESLTEDQPDRTRQGFLEILRTEAPFHPTKNITW
jgi:hypothetical protein